MELTIPYKDYLYEPDNYLIKIIEVVCEAGLILDTDLHIIYCSQKAFPNLRTKSQRERLIGTSVEKYDLQSPFAQVAKTGRPVRGFLLKNGIDKTNISHIFPIFCEGKVVGLLSVLAFDDLNALGRLLAKANSLPENELSGDIYSKISQTESKYTFNDYIGQSALVRQMIDLGKKAAKTEYPVLITGETGTGKEIIAHSIHAASFPKVRRPFVRINCTAIPSALLESELFGHEKGAFTGATAAKEGKFEIAKNGTILLDEIEAMDISLQGKLLRVLEEKEFERVGGRKLIPLTARIIASTNQRLGELCAQGKFRTDLYYRLNIIEIRLPSLKDHPGDIPLLVDHFREKNNFHFSLDDGALKTLQSYSWPGNVRELRNLMIKLSIMYSGKTAGACDVQNLLGTQAPQTKLLEAKVPRTVSHDTVSGTPAHIQATLDTFHGNIKYTAQALNMSRPTLYKKIRQYGLIIRRPDIKAKPKPPM
ncbi:MAG: sigma 54-interacting transcriptional regulator [Clostridiales bacterium]|nr:sigma 54-interacting transcriptional regulator [Clostridiales bacterium]